MVVAVVTKFLCEIMTPLGTLVEYMMIARSSLAGGLGGAGLSLTLLNHQLEGAHLHVRPEPGYVSVRVEGVLYHDHSPDQGAFLQQHFELGQQAVGVVDQTHLGFIDKN